jgi:hypothetical protein
MLKTCSVVLLAIAMSIGVAQARHVRGHRLLHVTPACAVGQPTAWKCNCGTAATPVLCQPGQWCHPSHVMAEGPFCGA